ncbi:MAG: SH3 domain-containing protein [Deltaproteobacteria bacterium]
MIDRRRFSTLFALITAGLFFLVGKGQAQDAAFAWSKATQDAAFAQANNQYKNGEYQDAVATYRSILDGGWESAALDFNLGNSYFRLHRLGHALVNYERARRMRPRDADIETNLNLARSQLAYTRPAGQGFLRRIIQTFFSWVSLDEATIALLALYLGLMALLGVIAVRPGAEVRLRVPLRVTACFFILGLSLLCVKIKGLGREALVVRPRAEARFAPFDTATAHFELSEGMTVFVVAEKPGWLEIERPDGKAGWIPQDAAVVI